MTTYKACVPLIVKTKNAGELNILKSVLKATHIEFEEIGWYPGTVVCMHCGEPDSFHLYINDEFVCRSKEVRKG